MWRWWMEKLQVLISCSDLHLGKRVEIFFGNQQIDFKSASVASHISTTSFQIDKQKAALRSSWLKQILDDE